MTWTTGTDISMNQFDLLAQMVAMLRGRRGICQSVDCSCTRRIGTSLSRGREKWQGVKRKKLASN